jgi:glycosyltransferase involved in cell wall biosynthesis
MEAMASGLPVVAANAMALPHLVHDGQNGYLFEPGSAQDLADKLSLVFSLSPEELDALKHESLKLIEAHDIKRTLNTFERLYRGESTVDPNVAALGNPSAAHPEVLDAAPSRD